MKEQEKEREIEGREIKRDGLWFTENKFRKVICKIFEIILDFGGKYEQRVLDVTDFFIFNFFSILEKWKNYLL